MMKSLQLYSIYHLNLAFSSIENNRHAEVVKNTYWPLLRLAEQFPIAIELTAYTLECIAKIDAVWLESLAELISINQVELIASGDSQIIAPLVPAEVTRQNLKLGMQAYQQYLNCQPQLAFINEQAFSRGVLDIYAEAGFKGIVMEWDNPFSHNYHWQAEYRYYPQLAQGNKHQLPVIWNHSIAFQKVQRYAHDEIILPDMLTYLEQQLSDTPRCFPLYGNDAEIFDFRPGRYQTEANLVEGEWLRITALYKALAQHPQIGLILPGQLLKINHVLAFQKLDLCTANMPVPVKKQRKYNLSRWAITGRDDLGLNSYCYQQYQRLQNKGGSDEQWRQLCRHWASDFRTHITGQRWKALQAELVDIVVPKVEEPIKKIYSGKYLSLDENRNKLYLCTPDVHVCLNLHKGMSVESLSFSSQNFKPVLGTIPHGYFDTIELGADFFTSMSLIEQSSEFNRLTDLEKVEPEIWEEHNAYLISAAIPTPLGILKKQIKIFKQSEQITLLVDARDLEKKLAVYRMQHITFVTQADRKKFTYACHNGGEDLESFELDGSPCLHTAPVSSMVSSSSGLGATKGIIDAGYKDLDKIRLQWEPAECAVFPMLHYVCFKEKCLARIIFSMGEIDETTHAGGTLGRFELSIFPKNTGL